MQEILVYCIVGVGSMITMGYAMHMWVGGLVSEQTESMLIALICLINLAAISYMVWDVAQRRKGNR